MIRIRELRRIETPGANEGDPPIVKVSIRCYVKLEDEYIYQQISVDDFDIENSTEEQVKTIVQNNVDQTNIKEIFKQRQKQKSSTYTHDGSAFKSQTRFEEWQSGTSYSVDDTVEFNGEMYRCVQSHEVTDPTWTPEATAALWSPILVFGDSFDPWQQPQGAHDAYPSGAIVSHNGTYYQALVGSNVWEPGTDDTLWVEYDETTGQPIVSEGNYSEWVADQAYITGDLVSHAGVDYIALSDHTSTAGDPPSSQSTDWEVYEPATTPEWAAGESYAVGDQVTYGGVTYEVIQAHTSQVGWEPPNVPSLWSAV